MNGSLNIVDLIENNPITRLSGTYQNKLLIKIKEKFKDKEQQMFVASFYCFLNNNQKNDFVIDLDDVWKWLGFSYKHKAKILLETNFVIDNDYKILHNQLVEQTKPTRGGHNKETIMLNIDTFKKFCLKAGTKKADELHEYYIKLEETLYEVMHEESNELKLLLECKNNELLLAEKNKDNIRGKTILEHFPNNTQCVYYGIIDNVSNNNEKLIKFGNSNFLKNRVSKHKDTYLNFRLVNAFKVDNKLQIENALKEHPFFIERLRTITLKSKKYIELLNINDIAFSDVDKIIKDIITSIEFSQDNYIKLLQQNKLLKKQIEEGNRINNTDNFILVTAENTQLKKENIILIKRYNSLKGKTICNDNTIAGSFTDNTINQLEVDNYGLVIQASACTTYTSRHADGKYHIDGHIFDNLRGSRQDVFSGIAYKTTGLLIKKDLMINKCGKIVSKKKCAFETNDNKFVKYGVNKP